MIGNEGDFRLFQLEKLWASVGDYLTKWQTKELAKYGADFCACCDEWLMDRCQGCPIAEYSRSEFCHDTPYDALADMENPNEDVGWFMDLVEEEYAYLVEVALHFSHQYQEEIGDA